MCQAFFGFSIWFVIHRIKDEHINQTSKQRLKEEWGCVCLNTQFRHILRCVDICKDTCKNTPCKYHTKHQDEKRKLQILRRLNTKHFKKNVMTRTTYHQKTDTESV